MAGSTSQAPYAKGSSTGNSGFYLRVGCCTPGVAADRCSFATYLENIYVRLGSCIYFIVVILNHWDDRQPRYPHDGPAMHLQKASRETEH